MRPVDTLLQATLLMTLWSTGVALGLSMTRRDFGNALGDRALIVRVLLLDVLVVPLVAWAVLRVVVLPSDLEAGLLLVAIASGGPLAIKATQLAGGDLPLSVALVVLLELANILAIPAWSALFLPGVVDAPIGAIAMTLVLLVVLPIAAGVALRRSARAHGWTFGLTTLSNVSLVLVVLLVIARDAAELMEAFREGAAMVAIVIMAVAIGAGWSIGGRKRSKRTTVALVTGIRASAPALAIAQTSFADHPGVTVAIVAFGTVSLLFPISLAVLLGRRIASWERNAIE